jgi:hypothetical protein
MSQGKSALSIVRKYHPNVNRVIDAKKPVTINVTAEDCRNGKKKGASSCAMARAFERSYDGAIISLATAYLVKGDTAIRYRVPDAVTREIVSFDRSKQFAPGEYKLAQIEPARKLGLVHKVVNRTDPSKYKKAPRKYHKTAGIRAL